MTMLLLLAACRGGYSVQGQLEDGIFGGPIGGFDLMATADAGDGLAIACQKVASPVADDGTFVLTGLCSGTSYTVTASDPVIIPELHSVPDGGFEGSKTLKAYQAPGGDGFYVLTASGLEPASTNAGFKTDSLPDGTPVRYPRRALKDPPLLAGDTRLVATGAMTEVPFLSMTAHPEGLKLADGSLPPTRTLGDAVESASAGVETVVAGDVKVHFYTQGVVPEGRYALVADGAQRLLVVDVGARQPASVAAEGGEQ